MADERKKNPYAVNGDELYRKYYSDAAPGAATGTPTLADMYQKITARPAFQYDAAADPLYQQSRDRYIQNARMAMRDTHARHARAGRKPDGRLRQQLRAGRRAAGV